MEKQPENEPEPQEAEAMEPELRAPGPGQVYAPSECGVSVTSGRTAPSEPGEPSELTSESGEPSELTESEPGITESESRSDDSSIAGSSTGPLMMEFLAQAEEQVASHSGATSTATGPRVSPTGTTRLLQEFVQARHPELVAGFPSSEAARRVGRALAVLGDEMEEQRRPALRRMMEQLRIPQTGSTATPTLASAETLSNISQQFSKSVRSEIDELFGSVSSFLQGFFSFVATRAAPAETGVGYEQADTTRVQASELTESEPGITESESRSDSSIVGSSTGPLMMEFLAQAEEQVASHSGATSTATGPRVSPTETTSGRTAPREPGEPSELTSESGEPSELTVSESRSDDSSIAMSSTGPSMMEFLAHTQLVHTTRVEANALSSKFDSLRSLSATGLIAEYDIFPFEPRFTQNRFTQLLHEHGTSGPRVRFTSSRSGIVIADTKHLFLYDDQHRQPSAHRPLWSENIGSLILDVASDNSTGRLYVLLFDEIDIYKLEKRGITLVVTVPLSQSDFGRIASSGDYLYITRERNGLVEKMDIHTHEITEIVSGLTRPTAVTAYVPNQTFFFVVADDHNVNIYSTNLNRRIKTIEVRTAIFDIEMIGDNIIVLTKNEIRRYESSL